jgi:hypothetical protein
VPAGYTQQYGIGKVELWAPTGRPAAYNVLLRHASYHDVTAEVLNSPKAFLDGPLKE